VGYHTKFDGSPSNGMQIWGPLGWAMVNLQRNHPPSQTYHRAKFGCSTQNGIATYRS